MKKGRERAKEVMVEGKVNDETDFDNTLGNLWQISESLVIPEVCIQGNDGGKGRTGTDHENEKSELEEFFCDDFLTYRCELEEFLQCLTLEELAFMFSIQSH